VKWTTAACVPGIISIGLPKLGVISLLIRLLLPGKTHVIILWAMGIICLLGLCAAGSVLIFQCGFPDALWNITEPRTCLNDTILMNVSYGTGSAYSRLTSSNSSRTKILTPSSCFRYVGIPRLLPGDIPGSSALRSSDAAHQESGHVISTGCWYYIRNRWNQEGDAGPFTESKRYIL
jgi:hypothetical protein